MKKIELTKKQKKVLKTAAMVCGGVVCTGMKFENNWRFFVKQ